MCAVPGPLLPGEVSGGLKNMAALCADIDYTFPEIQKLKDFLADPSAFASPQHEGTMRCVF